MMLLECLENELGKKKEKIKNKHKLNELTKSQHQVH